MDQSHHAFYWDAELMVMTATEGDPRCVGMRA